MLADGRVLQSPNDTRVYRYLTLNNGLRVLLIAEACPVPAKSAPGSVSSSNTSALDAKSEEGKSDEEDEGDGSGADEGDDSEADEGDGSDSSAGSDSRTAAVALAVAVGYFCDPPNYGGLAHFLEHMLFMGTKDYPDENE